jgi:hypothetical protein
VTFDVGVVYTSSRGLRHGRCVNVHSLYSVKYCWLIIVPFIAGLLWGIGLWIMGLMANGLVHPLRRLVGLVEAAIPKWMRN